MNRCFVLDLQLQFAVWTMLHIAFYTGLMKAAPSGPTERVCVEVMIICMTLSDMARSWICITEQKKLLQH